MNDENRYSQFFKLKRWSFDIWFVLPQFRHKPNDNIEYHCLTLATYTVKS